MYKRQELVYAMQSNSSTDDAMNLLKRIAHTPGAYNFGTRSLASALQWAEWGGRGWLGMYFKMIDLERHIAKLESMIYTQLYLAQESSRQKQWEL